MATFVVYSKLTQKEAQYTYDGIRKWFENNPNRNDCVTETFTVRRNHIKEDILKHAEDGVILSEAPKNKNFKKSLPSEKKAKKPVKKTVKKTAKK